MRSIVFNPASFTGSEEERIAKIQAFVRDAFCNDESNLEIGEFTTRCFGRIMSHGVIPDLVRGRPYRVVRDRLIDTFHSNGGEISVRRLMGGAIRIKIIRPLRDLKKEAKNGKRSGRRRKSGGNQEA